MESMSEKILDKIDKIADNVIRMDKELVQIKTLLETQIKNHIDNRKDIDENRERIRNLENWRWLVVGFSLSSSIIVPFIINKFL